jgi:hypothetical protein
VTNDTKLKLLNAASDLHDALHEETSKTDLNVLNLLRLQATASSHILIVLMALVDALPTDERSEDGEDPRQRKLF